MACLVRVKACKSVLPCHLDCGDEFLWIVSVSLVKASDVCNFLLMLNKCTWKCCGMRGVNG